MQYRVDLHTHSTASDGQYSPSELVQKAKAAGVECLALTDHDTLDGLDEAVQTGNSLGITVLRGVELGAQEDRHLHILGLGLSEAHTPLSELCRKMKASRDERKYRIIDFLAEQNVHISLDEVEAQASGQIIARPHFAQVLLNRGYVSSMQEAFDRYLDTDEYQKIERLKATAEECIHAIHSSGGHAVLAHPYQLGYDDDALDALLSQLKDTGLDGLECYYTRHTSSQIFCYLALADKYQLHITAGSDFHGENVRPDMAITPVPLELKWLLNN